MKQQRWMVLLGQKSLARNPAGDDAFYFADDDFVAA